MDYVVNVAFLFEKSRVYLGGALFDIFYMSSFGLFNICCDISYPC